MHKIILFLFAAVLMFGSCKEDKLLTYDRESGSVFFKYKKWPSPNSQGYTTTVEYEGTPITVKSEVITAAQDSVSFSFARISRDIPSVVTLIPVALMGDIADYDREMGYRILSSDMGEGPDPYEAVEGVDYKILKAFIPANKTEGGFIIELYRKNLPGDLDYRYLDLELIPNEYFVTDFTTVKRSNAKPNEMVSTLKMRLWFNDALLLPPLWGRSFGTFSPLKLQLLVEHTGLTYAEIYGEDGTQLSTTLAAAYATIFTRWLLVMSNAGKPVYEADKVTLMTMR